MNDLRKLIALLFAVLLPLQTLASMAMSMQAGAQAVGMQAEHCPGHADGGASRELPSSAGGLACEQCGLCHLACAGMVPSAEATPLRLRVDTRHLAEAEPMPASHIPEAPHPPPVPPRS